MRRLTLLTSVCVLAAPCLGCGEGPMQAPQSKTVAGAVKDVTVVKDRDRAAADKDKAPAAAAAPAAPAEAPRKIIYNARAELVVDDFGKAVDQLDQLVQEHKGYVARSDTHDTPGAPRSGEWTLRVPADQFRGFLAGLARLGELHESQTDSDDITDRYYDLQAHIKNDQSEEEALRKLMVERSANGKLEDLLVVRRELRDLRGQIDVQQGQMERWDKQVALTTIVVQIRDRKDYVPAAPPSFAATIETTFQGSIDGLLSLGRGVVLVVVALAPWVAVLAGPALMVWWAVRRHRRVARRAPAPPPAAP